MKALIAQGSPVIPERTNVLNTKTQKWRHKEIQSLLFLTKPVKKFAPCFLRYLTSPGFEFNNC